jgi:UDP-N-acetylglucosamine 4-epimerase
MKFNNYHIGHDFSKYSFLVTGGAGFIGSNLVEYLLQYNAGKIRILDNLSTGNINNIQEFLDLPNIEFIEGDIRSYQTCTEAMKGIDFVSHQAALGSVPRSINDPIATNDVNINGFLNILISAKEAKIKRLVYAASSSTYGDSKLLPKKEENIGMPLSPYAVTKYVNELYANVFSKVYGFHSVGLRYFNVFGPKQNINGPYAAVIPLFITTMLKNEQPYINGTGETSRDFTFISNVIQANIKSLINKTINTDMVINIACGERNTLIDLIATINENLGQKIEPIFRNFREGDVMHSLADISKAVKVINYEPEITFKEGIKLTISFFNK